MNILLTFTGFHDPYAVGLVGEEEQPGPILSLVGAKSFARIILFSTPGTGKNTLATKEALQSLHPKLEVEVKDFPLADPTDYIAILRGLRAHLQDICDSNPQAQFFIAVASGTPQMHACWVLLAASGEIPAHILHVRPPRFVSKDQPLVSEVDLTAPDFPLVRANVWTVEVSDTAPLDVETAIQQLGIVGDHPVIRKALEIGATLAPSTVPILTSARKQLILRALEAAQGNQSEAARFLGITPQAVHKFLRTSEGKFKKN